MRTSVNPPIPYVAVGRSETKLFEKPWYFGEHEYSAACVEQHAHLA